MKILLKVSQLNPDRTNYKVYGLTYQPEHLSVEVDVPDQHIVRAIEGTTEHGSGAVLSLDGLKWLVGMLADAVDEIQTEHINKLR